MYTSPCLGNNLRRILAAAVNRQSHFVAENFAIPKLSNGYCYFDKFSLANQAPSDLNRVYRRKCIAILGFYCQIK
jgi:hypothetical protein